MFKKLLIASAVMMSAPAFADNIGPEIGVPSPAFSAVTSGKNGYGMEPVDLDAIMGENGAVIAFARSLDWCPYCKAQAKDLKNAADPLDDLGWSLSLITYDAPETLYDFGEAFDINYLLLSDESSKMIDAFNLRNTEMTPGGRYDGIPHPAIIFISPEGEVEAMLREEHYQDRPPVELVIETAEGLNK